MDALELKRRMLQAIKALKDGEQSFSLVLSDKDLFILEHFIKGFPVEEGKEVKDG